MTAETYSSIALEYIEWKSQVIQSVSNTLGISSYAVAGSIAEEANSVYRRSVANSYQDWRVRSYTHEEIQGNYNYVTSVEFDKTTRLGPGNFDKLENVALNQFRGQYT